MKKDPTPEQIRQLCAQIRRRCSCAEERRRIFCKPSRIETQVVSAAGIEVPMED